MEDVEIVGRAGDGEEAMKSTEEIMPDLLVMGLDMPKISGLEALLEIKRRCPRVRILVLTAYEDEEHVRASLKAGANGYLLKDASFDELVMGIRTVLKGEVYVDPSALKPVVEGYLRGTRTPHSLTKRERQILDLIVKGHHNPEMAKELSIHLKTVEKHRSNLMKKLDVHSTADLITLALSKGLVLPPEHKTFL
jgi:DNA-binding NarL/FixJ family response regulator